MNSLKDVLVVSRPIAPPWQDSNKNLTKNIISHIDSVRFNILTPKGYQFKKDNVISEDIYQSVTDLSPVIQKNLQALFYLITVNKKIDLFHFLNTPNLKSSVVLKHLTKFRNKPCIQTVMSSSADLEDYKNIFFADKIVALSDYTKNKLEQAGLENVIRIYPGVDLKEIDNYDSYNNDFKKRNGLLEDYLILFAGDYEFTKTNHTILECVPPIVSKFPNTKFLFACRNKTKESPSIEAELRKRVIDLGIDKYVIFLGTADNMLEVIRSIDICLYPVKSLATKMDIPLVLLECMAHSKPVIISDIAPLNELMKDDIGFKVQIDDKSLLVNSILDLLNDNNLRFSKGYAARKVIDKYFNMILLAKDYEKLYQDLLT